MAITPLHSESVSAKCRAQSIAVAASDALSLLLLQVNEVDQLTLHLGSSTMLNEDERAIFRGLQALTSQIIGDGNKAICEFASILDEINPGRKGGARV